MPSWKAGESACKEAGIFREKGLSSTGPCIITVTLESPGNLKRKLRLFQFSGSHVGLTTLDIPTMLQPIR
jgi:hypothetical protein